MVAAILSRGRFVLPITDPPNQLWAGSRVPRAGATIVTASGPTAASRMVVGI
jgi:hypothetical protein